MRRALRDRPFGTGSFACIAFGFGSYFVPLADWRVSSLLWNIPTSAGPALLFAGMARFYGGTQYDRFVYGLIAAGIIASVALSYGWPNTTIRIAALGSTAIGGYVGAALVTASTPVANARLASRLLAATFLADAASLTVRALVIVAAGGA
jgi:hypothetical protein